jgi:hypothetical protein
MPLAEFFRSQPRRVRRSFGWEPLAWPRAQLSRMTGRGGEFGARVCWILLESPSALFRLPGCRDLSTTALKMTVWGIGLVVAGGARSTTLRGRSAPHERPQLSQRMWTPRVSKGWVGTLLKLL